MALRLLAAAHLRHVCFGVFSGEKRGVVSCHVTATVASKEPPRRPVVTVKWFTVLLYVRPAVLARCQYNVDLRSEDHGLKSVWIGDPGDTKQLIQSGRLGGGSDHQGAAGELGSASSGSSPRPHFRCLPGSCLRYTWKGGRVRVDGGAYVTWVGCPSTNYGFIISRRRQDAQVHVYPLLSS